MDWFEDIRQQRLAREGANEAAAEQRESVHKRDMAALTSEVHEMVFQRLCELGEAYWGYGQFHIYASHSSWTLFHSRWPDPSRKSVLSNDIPTSDYDYWQLNFEVASKEETGWWNKKIKWKKPRFSISAGKPYHARQSMETNDVSEDELRRILRFAAENGPCYMERGAD